MRLLSLVVVFTAVSAQADAQNSRELWRRNTNGRISLQNVLPSGDLLVSTDARTMVLSPETGEVKWQRDDVVSCEVRQDRGPTPTCRVGGDQREYMSSFGPYLRFETDLPDGTPSNFLNQSCRADRACIESQVLRGAAKKGIGMSFKPTHDRGRLLLVDAATGRDVFDSIAAGLEEVDGTCLLPRENRLIAWDERERRPVSAVAFDLAAAKILWTRELPALRDVQCLPLDGAGLVLAYGREGDKPRVFGIDAATGLSRWESAALAEKEWKLPVALVDSSSIAIVHVNASGPMQIDIQKGTALWRVDPFAGGEPVGDVNGRIPRPQPIVRSGELYYLTWKQRLVALTRAGTVAWTRTFEEPPVLVAETPLGLLTRGYVGSERMRLEIVRPENGQTRWSAVVSGISGWLLTPEALLHVANNKLQRLSLATGETQVLGDAAFSASDPPVDVSLLGDAVVVTSSEHVAAFEQKGGTRYQLDVPTPGMSRAEQMLAVALAGVRTAASHAAARNIARVAATEAAYVTGGSATVYYFYSAYQPNLERRFASTASAEQFAYMFTTMAGGPGFRVVRFDKLKGTEAGWIPFTERRPRYSIDSIAGRVFARTGDAEVAAYAFNP